MEVDVATGQERETRQKKRRWMDCKRGIEAFISVSLTLSPKHSPLRLHFPLNLKKKKRGKRKENS